MLNSMTFAPLPSRSAGIRPGLGLSGGRHQRAWYKFDGRHTHQRFDKARKAFKYEIDTENSLSFISASCNYWHHHFCVDLIVKSIVFFSLVLEVTFAVIY